MAAHEHGGFDQSILPRQPPEGVVTDNADAQREADQSDCHGKMQQDPSDEDMVGGQGLAVVFKGHPSLVDSLNCQTKEAECPMGKISEEVGSVFRIWDMGYRI